VNRETGGFVPQLAYAESGGFRSNRVMVGENGREIVDLPVGSRVRSAGETRNSNVGGNTTYIINTDSRARAKNLILDIQNEKRKRGVSTIDELIPNKR